MSQIETEEQVKVEAHHVGLFETPIAYCRLKNGEDLMTDLEQAIRSKMAEGEGVQRSNIGGWHSTTDMLQWAERRAPGRDCSKHCQAIEPLQGIEPRQLRLGSAHVGKRDTRRWAQSPAQSPG